MPAVALGVHHLRLLQSDQTVVKSKCIYNTIAWFYMVILILSTAFWVYAAMPISHMQNERQVIASFTKAAHFWVIYYSVMMYLPCWILSINYLRYMKR